MWPDLDAPRSVRTLGAHFAIRQPNTFGQFRHHLGRGYTGHEGAIELFDTVSRMSQPVGKVAVVGQDHEPGAILVETADGVDPLRNLGEKVDDARTARGVDVGRNVALGFVHGVIDIGLES